MSVADGCSCQETKTWGLEGPQPERLKWCSQENLRLLIQWWFDVDLWRVRDHTCAHQSCLFCWYTQIESTISLTHGMAGEKILSLLPGDRWAGERCYIHQVSIHMRPFVYWVSEGLHGFVADSRVTSTPDYSVVLFKNAQYGGNKVKIRFSSPWNWAWKLCYTLKVTVCFSGKDLPS